MKAKLFFIVLFTIHISYSQEIKTEFVSKKPLEADIFIGVDDLDHLYYLKNNTLFKNRKNDTINYSNISLGKITSINIQNPFKIVVFYKDFNSIILLDNNLNELTNRIDLTKETLFDNVQFVGISSQNDLWLYSNNSKLYLYDYKNHSVKIKSQPISFYQNDFYPKQLKSTYKNIWLLADEGVIQFNEYGNYLDFNNVSGITNIFPLENRFTYIKNNNLFLLDNKKIVPIQLSYSKSLKNIYINKTSIYIFDGLNIHKFKFL